MNYRTLESAPRTGVGILAYRRHDRDDPPGAARGVKAGDHWWAILLWNVWGEPGWVFAKDGAPAWNEPTHWTELEPPQADKLRQEGRA